MGDFRVGDYVMKVTGDYRLGGEVRSVFTTMNGKTRYVVEHWQAASGLLHIYSAANLELAPHPQPEPIQQPEQERAER